MCVCIFSQILSEIEEHVARPFEVYEDSLEHTEPTHADDGLFTYSIAYGHKNYFKKLEHLTEKCIMEGEQNVSKRKEI